MLKVTIGHIRVDSEDAMEEISNIVNSVANVTEEGPDFIIVADLNPSTITKLSKDGYITEEDAMEIPKVDSIKFYLDMREYKVIITGPKVYLPEGIRVEDIIITDEEIEDSLEEDQTEEECIQYILNEIVSEWEQGWCSAIVVTTESINKLKGLL